jgi:hypothetical protein
MLLVSADDVRADSQIARMAWDLRPRSQRGPNSVASAFELMPHVSTPTGLRSQQASIDYERFAIFPADGTLRGVFYGDPRKAGDSSCGSMGMHVGFDGFGVAGL